MPSNAFLTKILPFFPVTFLVVTTINMLTFGILGSFQIHRKTMIDLGALAVIGIQERPYLAHNFNSYHREKNHDPAIISRFWPKSCSLWLFLRLFCHFFGCHGHEYACFAHAPAHARCMRKEPAPLRRITLCWLEKKRPEVIHWGITPRPGQTNAMWAT